MLGCKNEFKKMKYWNIFPNGRLGFPNDEELIIKRTIPKALNSHAEFISASANNLFSANKILFRHLTRRMTVKLIFNIAS